MRWFVRTAILLAVVSSTLVALPVLSASACSCGAITLPEAVDRADLIVIGEQFMRQGWILGDPTLMIIVHGTYKGRAGPMLRVNTYRNGDACGANYKGRGPLGLFISERRDDGSLWVSTCSYSATPAELADHYGFEAPAPPLPTMGRGVQGPARVVLVAAILSAGVAVAATALSKDQGG